MWECSGTLGEAYLARVAKLLVKLASGGLTKASYEDLAEAVYALVQLVPPGKVTTYGSLAKALGVSARIVGKILAENEHAPVVPCHRVVRSDGDVGGYSKGGREVKKRLLELEGVRLVGWRVPKGFVVDVGGMVVGEGSSSASSAKRQRPGTKCRRRPSPS